MGRHQVIAIMVKMVIMGSKRKENECLFIDRQLQDRNKLTKLEERMESIKIKGMSCGHCVGSVKKALEDIAGISQVSVDLDKAEATFHNENVDREQIRAAISKIGFEPGE